MNNKILGMNKWFFYSVIGVCVLGILIGTFFDYSINVCLANKTELGAFFATYGSYFSYCLYPVAGMCIFKGLIKKSTRYKLLAWIILIISYFMAVYYSNSYNGSKVREAFGYVAGSSSILLSVLSWGLWVLLYSWVPALMYFVLDDSNSDKLLVVGLTILVAGIVADNVNLWLKQVASRPRYKYLITLEDPLSEFRAWYEWIPNKAGSNDNFKSWPSGNMTIAAMMFSLPLVVSSLKKSNNTLVLLSFIFAALFVALYGYNRIHMTNHFLSDVCSGVLITYLIHAGVNIGFNRLLE